MTIVLVAKYYVKPGNSDAVIEALKRMKPLVEKDEPGCLLYQVSLGSEAENLVMLYEHYIDEAALSAHREMPHFKQIIEGEVVPMLERRERELYTLQIS